MNNQYKIRLSGLSSGIHHFNFSVKDDFFESIAFGEIRKGNVRVAVEMTKEETMILLLFTISGTANIMCDRCAEMYDQEINGGNRLILKYGTAASQESEDIVVIPYGESSWSVAPHIYEFIHLLLPQKRLHPEGHCNPEMVKKLEEHSAANRHEGSDPRWDALKEAL